jgi:hypothetical protein
MVVLTRRQINLIRMGGIVVIALCCCGAFFTLAGGAIVVKQQPEVLARLGLPVSGTEAVTQTVESPLSTPGALVSPLDTPGAFDSPLFNSPLPTPTEVPPPTPTPEPPSAPPTQPPPEAPPAPAPTPRLIAYYVTGDIVNVREGPSADAKIVRRARYGDTIAVYEDSVGQEWYRIAGESGDEYIAAEFTSNTVPPTNTPAAETPAETPTGEETPEGGETPEATPTEALPTPPPGQGLLIVYVDYLGEEVTFNIADKEYKISYGSHKEIPLAPGRYSWTMSAPVQGSVNHDIEIREGETQTLHF